MILNSLLAINAIFICYFWLNGSKDIVYVVHYYLNFKKIAKYANKIQNLRLKKRKEKVLLVYCTCNDFEESSLEKCIRQNYKNTKTVILDDSSDEEYKKRIDIFAKNKKSRST